MSTPPQISERDSLGRLKHAGTFPNAKMNLSGRPAGALGDTTKRAMELLRAKAEAMVAKLTHIATEDCREGGDACIACGRGIPRNEELQVKAIIAALDRCGMGPQSKIDVTMKDDTSWTKYLSDEQVEVLASLVEAGRAAQALAAQEAQAPAGASTIVEGVLLSASTSEPQGEAPTPSLGP